MELVKNLKQTNIYKYFLVILISSTLLAISAKLKIPFYPVPMTMQTFVVLLIGVCFGWKLGGAIITFYLFLMKHDNLQKIYHSPLVCIFLDQ